MRVLRIIAVGFVILLMVYAASVYVWIKQGLEGVGV